MGGSFVRFTIQRFGPDADNAECPKQRNNGDDEHDLQLHFQPPHPISRSTAYIRCRIGFLSGSSGKVSESRVCLCPN